MTTSRFFTCTDPRTNRVHLRKTAGNVYTWAVVNRSSAQWSSRRDLAEKNAKGSWLLVPVTERNARGDWLVVPVTEITAEQYRALDKASKTTVRVKHEGKAYTKSVPAGSKAPTHAVISTTIEHTVTLPVPASWLHHAEKLLEDTKAGLLRFPDREWLKDRLVRDQNRVDQERARAGGTYDTVHPGRVDVDWYYSLEDAERAAARFSYVPGFRLCKVVPVEA